ncbi:MAG: hypothetical protein H0W44_06755 [Gammaproteobacteria bacterium]|nr:hypothetical protein [Gammaproteobacteria bacterium]
MTTRIDKTRLDKITPSTALQDTTSKPRKNKTAQTTADSTPQKKRQSRQKKLPRFDDYA